MNTPQWMIAWYEAQPQAQVCRDCGKDDDRAYVQPQPPRRKRDIATHKSYALCIDCIARINRAIDQRRKAELNAMPRCDIDGCNRRSLWLIGNGPEKVRVCGRHFKRAQRNWDRQFAGATIWLPAPTLSKAALLRLAS